MSKIYLKGAFCYREDTLENWITHNPVLEKGEVSLISEAVSDEWLKIGDGKTQWVDLPWKIGPRGPQGVKGDKGDKGDSYNLTEADKTDIAELVLANFVDVSEVGR